MAGKRRSASFPILSDDGDSDALSSGYSAFTDSFIDRKRDEESRLASQGAESADSIPLVDISERDEEQPVKKRRKRITPNTKLKHKRRRRRSTVHDAFIESSKNTPHYVKEENSNNLLARARLRIFRGVDSLPVRLLGLLILLIDVVFVIVEFSIGNDSPFVGEEAFQVLDLIFSAYFCIEVSLRIIGEGKVFFRRWFEVFDLIAIVISTLFTIIYVIIVNENPVLDGKHIFVSVSRLVIAGRIVRVFFWARLVYEHKSLARYFRSKVSQNKRRYVKDGFDLDLTYVTDRVIAMSFPSSGSQSLYRNSIQEVGEFLDKYHFGHYRVYNMCSEQEYDTSYFHNQVQRILIDDHNVPKLTDLIDFCEDAYTWLEAHKQNVIVVHCKGGKGRTGMMISAWLVRSGLFEAAGDSLAYFSDRRTDKSRGKKSQGVETPSQSRYVKYYEKLFTQMKGNLPPPVSLRVKQMTIHGLSGVGKGDGTDWSFEVYLMNDKVFKCSLLEPKTRHVHLALDQQSDTTDIVFSETRPLIVADDVRFKFYCSTKTIPTGNDKCQFYFWFHTTFIENLKISLDRSELDNLQKSKTQRYYPVGFAIELNFETSTIPGRSYSIIDGDELSDDIDQD